MSDARRPVSVSDLGDLVVAFGALVVMLFWLGIVWDISRERARALASAEADTGNLARAFQEHIGRTVAGLDQTLLYLKAEYERDPARFSLDRSVATTSLSGIAVQAALIGADGWLEQSTLGAAARVNLGDREHFRVHAANDNVGLFVSTPVLGRASGRWSVPLTRRANRPDGGLGAVLMVALDPSYLNHFYGSVDVGRDGLVMLAGLDGVVRASSRPDLLGKPLPPEVMSRLGPAAAGAVRQLAVGDDGVRRVASFRTLDGLPLVVLVGRSEVEVLAGVHSLQTGYMAVGALVSLVLAGVVAVLFRMARRLQSTSRDLGLKKTELVASRDRLRRYLADLERVADVAAHDLREPLRRVVAYSQLLAEEAGDNPTARGYADHVVDGARRMRALVDDLRAYVSAEHLPPATGTVDSAVALTEAGLRLAEEMALAGADLTMGKDLPAVAVDHASLVEVFEQLLDNAVRFRAADRALRIVVEARADGDQAVFSVRDNGVGIERRRHARVFDIFHRDGDGAGTGMGLAVVRRLVERFGGRAWVESEPGEGSVFSFSLPLRPAQAGEGEGVAATQGQEAKAAA